MLNNPRPLDNIGLNPTEQLELYRLLVDSVQDYAIFLLDASGYISSWNLGAEKLKGYKPEEIIGSHFSCFYMQRDIDAHRPEQNLRDCGILGHIEDEGWRIRKDGSRFWADVIITAVRDKSGKLIGYAKVTRDLTERKRHENDLQRANAVLRKQRQELEDLNKAKDEFISLASHQLRTPATGVKQFLGLILEGYAGDLSEQQCDFLKKAYDSNNRQIDLINDLLKVAQVDAGKVTLHKEPVDINELIKNIVDEQADTFKDRKQAVTLDVNSERFVANADERRFRMVLENLIDNASKYTPEGGRIHVSASATKDTVRIDVSDSGVGISEESLLKLFKKFSRIPNELSDSVGGSGLGLYWAYKIVQLHGGDIHVDSHLGKGSVFHVDIPRYLQDE
jgi:PAS domain S-box-containing protein